jgi:twitching motility protein PilT
MMPLKMDPLLPAETKQICYSILTDAQKRKFEEENELDSPSASRGWRVSAATSSCSAGPWPGFPHDPLQDSHLRGTRPAAGRAGISRKPRGLVLVTGPTGSGKSTTLASIIDAINSERRSTSSPSKIPIEYLHPHKKCVVNQREVGADTHSFKKALKYILRQDPTSCCSASCATWRRSRPP